MKYFISNAGQITISLWVYKDNGKAVIKVKRILAYVRVCISEPAIHQLWDLWQIP